MPEARPNLFARLRSAFAPEKEERNIHNFLSNNAFHSVTPRTGLTQGQVGMLPDEELVGVLRQCVGAVDSHLGQIRSDECPVPIVGGVKLRPPVHHQTGDHQASPMPRHMHEDVIAVSVLARASSSFAFSSDTSSSCRFGWGLSKRPAMTGPAEESCESTAT